MPGCDVNKLAQNSHKFILGVCWLNKVLLYFQFSIFRYQTFSVRLGVVVGTFAAAYGVYQVD